MAVDDAGLAEAEAGQLLEVLGKVYAPLAQKQVHAECWARFLEGTRPCIAILFCLP